MADHTPHNSDESPWREYAQIEADQRMEEACRQLVRLAVFEDLERQADWTTVLTVPANVHCRCEVRARHSGIAAGLVCLPWIVDEMEADIEVTQHLSDADSFQEGTLLASLSGDGRDMLTCERVLLNFLCRLCGIATTTQRYVKAVEGTSAKVYDTRKTTPGWRRLEKYAVGCGGGTNHRTGLFDGFLIKDNHLALAAAAADTDATGILKHIQKCLGGTAEGVPLPRVVEIEVDNLEQFEQVLPQQPTIILLDNFSLADLRSAVARRQAVAPHVQLEASGGIELSTIRAVAETGVDRISCGALTHSAAWLDLGLDWQMEG